MTHQHTDYFIQVKEGENALTVIHDQKSKRHAFTDKRDATKLMNVLRKLHQGKEFRIVERQVIHIEGDWTKYIK